ncbi:MAG: hypothetical protein KF686_11135 [Ramlibacter sp.]|nr:hypothetical protein [Ramlibacter sp.]
MTVLRDARLVRALEFAPDRAEVPASRTHSAIKKIAIEALTRPPQDTVRRPPWWQRFWPPALGGGPRPWNAALATVLLAGLVTVLWQGQEPPGAQLDGPAVAALPEKGPASQRESRSAPEPVTAGAGPEAPRVRRELAPPPTRPPVRASQPRPPVADAQPSPAAESAAPDQAMAPVARAPAPVAPARPSAAAARSAPMAKALGGAVSGAASDQAAMASPSAWTDVLIREGGRELQLPRARAERLAALLQPLWPTAQDWAGAPLSPEAESATLQLELRLSGEAPLTLDLSARQAQWTWRDAAGLRRVARQPGPEALAALHEEVSRLLSAR